MLFTYGKKQKVTSSAWKSAYQNSFNKCFLINVSLKFSYKWLVTDGNTLSLLESPTTIENCNIY